MKLSRVQRDEAKSLGGVWWTFEAPQERCEGNKPHATKFCMLIAERFNPRHREALARHRLERRQDLIAGGAKAEKAERDIDTEAMADGLLLGWANADNEDGTKLEYSRAEALRVLNDVELWPIRSFIEDVSSIALQYHRAMEADALGN